MDGAHVDWWRAAAPEVEAHFAGGGGGGGLHVDDIGLNMDLNEPIMPDPLWVDHGTAVLRAVSEPEALHEYTLPVDFTEEEVRATHHPWAVLPVYGCLSPHPGHSPPIAPTRRQGFVFKTGHVLHLAPDAFHKRQPHASAASAPGTYAVWLENSPRIDPELLRFTPPTNDELGGAEPAQCSLITYLRLAVLEGGGFPGCLGLPAYEPLRAELTKDLLPF